MRKFLFIGVGGSGGKTLRFLKDVLKQRLAEVGYSGPLPDAWQFVQIDLPPADDAAVGKIPATLGAAYRGIAPSGVNYSNHLQQLASKGDRELIDDLSTWWPNPAEAPRQVWFGAGQYRAVGRVITLNRLAEVRVAIESAVTAMELDAATKNFDEIARVLGFEVGGQLNEPIAIVVGSMAGGTGAGAMLDICDLLRISGEQNRPFLQLPFGVLYTASIFGANAGTAMPGIEPNSLAFASELSALLKQEVSRTPVFHAASGAAAVLTQRGPALSFLIGRGNGNLTLADEIEVFRSTAQAMAAWVLDPGVQLLLQSSPIGNLNILGNTRSAHPMHRHESDRQPVSSFGYAKFGISRRRFHEYAAERLARMVIDHLLRAHLQITGEDQSAAAAIDQVATPQRLNQFLAKCKINERLGTDNDIIDEIRRIADREMGSAAGSSDLRGDITVQAAEVVDAVLNSPAATARGFTAASANRSLQTRAEDKAKFVVPKWENAFRAAGAKWIEHIKPVIVNGVVETMSVLGLPVTVSLVRQANIDLEQAIVNLQNEAASCSGQSRNRFTDLPVDGGKSRITALINKLRSSYSTAVGEYLAFEIEARLRAQAIEAINVLRSSFMTPLAAALADAERELREEWPAVKGWAAGTTIPERFRPDPNVVLLLDPDDYPSTFDSLLAKTVGGSGSIVVENAVRAVLAAGDDGAGRNARGIGSFITFSELGVATGRSDVAVHANVDEVRDRCWRWLKSDPTIGIGQFITSSLQDVLDSSSKAQIDEFVSKFRTAIDRSAPLIDYNPSVMTLVHQSSEPEYQRAMSLIPLEPDETNRAYMAVRDLLLSYTSKSDMMDAASIVKMFGKAAADGDEVGDIEMSTFMRAYHPMVFSSLMNPIATAAQTAMGKGDFGFWSMRRSRPLSEFVPLGARTLGFLARGWFVASVLGMLRYDTSTVNGLSFTAASLLTPTGAMSFIAPGLGRLPTEPRDVFAAVLEAYPLAEALAATAQPEMLKPYERLLDLGSGIALQDWISTGEVDAGALEVIPDREQRVAYVESMLEEVRKRLLDYDREFTPDPNLWALPPRGMEVRNLVLSAVDALQETVKAETVRNTTSTLPQF